MPACEKTSYTEGNMKNANISKPIQDTAVVTMEDDRELVYDLSNGATSIN